MKIAATNSQALIPSGAASREKAVHHGAINSNHRKRVRGPLAESFCSVGTFTSYWQSGGIAMMAVYESQGGFFLAGSSDGGRL